MVIEEHARLEILLPNESDWRYINENDIINNSLSIISKCMDDSSFSIGGVYSAQLSVKIRLSGTNSYNVTGAKIKVYSHYDNDSEHLRGVFWATSVSRIKDIYSISASDSIVWLDTIAYDDSCEGKNLIYDRLLSDEYTRTLQDLLNLSLYELNGILAQRHIDTVKIEYNNVINDLPQKGFCIASPEAAGKISSKCPRDYVSWLAELACGFICSVPDPNISKIKIGQFETSPSFEISYDIIQLDSCEIAEYSVYYSRVYAELYDGSSGSSYDVINDENGNEIPDDTGITLDVSDNPFLVGHWEQNNQNALDVMTTLHSALDNIPIVPFKLVCHCRNFFRLGQCVKLPDGQNSVITNLKWQFRGGYTLSCAGKDTRTLCDSARRSQALIVKDLAYNKINSEIARLNSSFGKQITGVNQNITNLGDTSNDQQSQIAYAHDRIDTCEGRLDKIETILKQLNGGE